MKNYLLKLSRISPNRERLFTYLRTKEVGIEKLKDGKGKEFGFDIDQLILKLSFSEKELEKVLSSQTNCVYISPCYYFLKEQSLITFFFEVLHKIKVNDISIDSFTFQEISDIFVK